MAESHRNKVILDEATFGGLFVLLKNLPWYRWMVDE
jgi:hypothetical protein